MYLWSYFLNGSPFVRAATFGVIVAVAQAFAWVPKRGPARAYTERLLGTRTRDPDGRRD
jgi:hypothetical protein